MPETLREFSAGAMREQSPAEGGARPHGTLARWRGSFGWYLLLIPIAVVLTVGLSLWIGRGTPEVIIAALVIVLLGIVLLIMTLPRPGRLPEPTSPSSDAGRWRTTDPSTARSPFDARPADLAGARRQKVTRATRLSAEGRAGSGRYSTARRSHDSAGNDFVPSAGRLAMDLVEPRPETVHAPSPAEIPSLHEEREPRILEPGFRRPLATATPFSVSGGSPLLPKAAGGLTDFSETALEHPAAPPRWRSRLLDREGSPVPTVTIADLVLREARNPTPPHLRPIPKPAGDPFDRPPARTSVDAFD